MREDVEAADQMIARLGEFLRDLAKFRRARDHLGAGEFPGMLPGDREAAFSRPPYDADRSRVGRDGRPSAEPVSSTDSRKRHPPRRRPANERGRRRDQRRDAATRLRVEVRDNGPGLTAKNGVADGVGLANTRSRLRRLYGDDHNFGMTNAVEGGLIVTLEIPFHAKPSRQVATP